jgi:superfamily II DNA or RNA helicase
MLIFEKIDDVYFLVKPDVSSNYVELQELQIEFTLEHPNKINMTRYKNKGNWDGKVRFIKYLDRNKEVAIAPIGLISEIIKFLDLHNIDYEFKNDNIGIMDVIFDDFDAWLEEIEKHNTKKITDREYQYLAVTKALKLNRCILESPTGSGKSNIIYTYIQWILDHDFKNDEKFIVVVPSVDLVEQMADDFIEYGMNPDIISKIHKDTDKNFDNTVIISTWQSIYTKPYDWFEQFSGLVVDECHKAKAEELIYVCENCISSRWRMATSGTVYTEKFYKYSIMANFGFPFRASTTRELIDLGYLSEFHVRSVVLNWKSSEPKQTKLEIKDYDEEFKRIIENEPRKNLIVKFVKNLWKDRSYEKSTILVMCKRVEYIEDLYVKMKDAGLKKVFFIHGNVPPKERKKVIQYVKENGGIVIANVTIMGTGINIPNVSTIVMANPLKSDILLLQTIGRSIRLYEDKESSMIYDIIDNIPIKGKKENTTYGWKRDKTRIYETCKFKYDTLELDFIHE